MEKSMTRILYIEDDEDIGKLCGEDLTERGYLVHWLKSGEEALSFDANVEIIILDVMLPGLDGFTVGQRLKQRYPHTPILMLSARSSVDDKLYGLQFADDYLTKPFHPDELAARIEVLLRRTGQIMESDLEIAHLKINIHQNQILDRRTNQEILLTGKQFRIFMYFLRHPNQILSKEQIYEAVWGEAFIVGDKSVMVHIRHIREKIEERPGFPKIIETIRGLGYRVRQ